MPGDDEIKIAFISAMSGYPWGGSEILWSETAHNLKRRQLRVFASVHGWAVTPKPVNRLRESGIEVHERVANRGLMAVLKKRMCAKFPSRSLWLSDPDRAKKALRAFNPDLVCVSQGGISDGIEWIEYCAKSSIPYIVLSQANAEWWWPDDALAERLRAGHSNAVSTCFVSKGNLALFETQIGARLENSRVVWNPFQIPYDSNPPWPADSATLRLACVGRLAMEKGQDLILRVLARPDWKDRPVHVSFFGKGPIASSLRRLAELLEISNKVTFHGQVENVEAIWANHHALILPSRCEGLPLALVEALLCGRPVLVTDVAGNAEVVEDGHTGFIAAAPTVPLIAEMMERAWERREDWEAMGIPAAQAIRELIPKDPVQQMADAIMECVK